MPTVRNAYTTTFPTKENYKQLMKPNPNLTIEQAWEIIHKSEGNYAEIIKFLDNHTEENSAIAGEKEAHCICCSDGDGLIIWWNAFYDYLCSFSDKDLRDITAEVLEAHWVVPPMHPMANEYGPYRKGGLPARISNEMVRPYREELACFKGMTAEEIRQWVIDSIVIDDSSNYFGCPISPVGVYKLRRADSHSRDIFFVAACRAAGVPAYLDNATNILYTWSGKSWQTTPFSINDISSIVSNPATLTLTYRGKEPAKPVYWPHFTLAKLENGDLRTFDFEDDPRMASLPATIELEPGIYCLSTGNRYPDGAVRSRLEFFEVKSGEKVTKEIVILPLIDRQNTEHLTLNPNLELFDGIELWDYAGDAGMLYINLGDYSEPSKHLIVELKQLQKEVKAWGGMTFMVGPTTIGMPSWGLINTDFAYRKGLLEQRICNAAKIDKVEYPLVALIDKNGHIRYHSTGYKIGVIEQVLKAARR